VFAHAEDRHNVCVVKPGCCPGFSGAER
jgi:hypothetical protein